MARQITILGIIPARGGSKGLPRKNISLLAGKPLIAYAIEAAQNSTTLSRTIVSTDDHEIAETARRYGGEVPFLRPPELATDEAPMVPVLQHAVQWLEQHDDQRPDLIVLLQPTTPFRRAEHIDQAVNKLLETGADSVLSLREVDYPPFWMKRLEGDRVYPLMEEGARYTRRQDTPVVYRPNGVVYVTRYKVLMEQDRVLGDDTRAIVMDFASSVNIDTEWDFKMAELMLRERGACTV